MATGNSKKKLTNNMRRDRVNILNVRIDNLSIRELLENLTDGLLVTPNVDHLIKLQKDKEFFDIYEHAEWVICDSNIVLLASKFLGKGLKQAIPGSTFLPAFCEFHRFNEDIRIFLLGGMNGVADTARENINKKIGRNIVVGSYSPTFGFEKRYDECQSIISEINGSESNVLVIGVGAPKQEKWVSEYRKRLINTRIIMCLGATIDFEAGNVKRAPRFMQKLYLEWLFRLIIEPKRLWKRYLIDDLPFFLLS